MYRKILILFVGLYIVDNHNIPLLLLFLPTPMTLASGWIPISPLTLMAHKVADDKFVFLLLDLTSVFVLIKMFVRKITLILLLFQLKIYINR